MTKCVSEKILLSDLMSKNVNSFLIIGNSPCTSNEEDILNLIADTYYVVSETTPIDEFESLMEKALAENFLDHDVRVAVTWGSQTEQIFIKIQGPQLDMEIEMDIDNLEEHRFSDEEENELDDTELQ